MNKKSGSPNPTVNGKLLWWVKVMKDTARREDNHWELTLGVWGTEGLSNILDKFCDAEGL